MNIDTGIALSVETFALSMFSVEAKAMEGNRSEQPGMGQSEKAAIKGRQ